MEILKALELTNPSLANSTAEEFKKILGDKEENSQKNTETESSSETRQDSI